MPSARPLPVVFRALERPRALAAIVALAVVLALPSLAAGFYTDDFAHLAVLEGVTPRVRTSTFDLFRFVGADRAELAELMGRGPIPWFADPALKLHFFRPLTSALIALDHALHGRSVVGYHLSSILLFALLVASVGLFYRTVLPGARGMAALSTLIFALASANAQPIAWSAGRHLLLIPALTALALTAHLRFHREGWRPGAWLGPLGLVAALLAGEAALGGAVFWVVHAALGPPSPREGAPSRFRAALPAVLVVLAYTAVYKALGFGAHGSQGYIDPATDPVAFASALTLRLPALIGDATTGLPAELIHLVPATVVIAVGAIGLLVTAGTYRAASPGVADEERAALRWLVPGALIALVLASGGFVGSRLLVLPNLGASVLFAVVIARGISHVNALLPRVGVALALFVHLVGAPLGLVLGQLSIASFAAQTEVVAREIEIPRDAFAHVVVVAASDPAVAFYPSVIRAADLEAERSRWHVLSMAKYEHRITRTGLSSLRVEALGGRMVERAFETLMRGRSSTFHEGDRVRLQGLTVTVVAVDRGLPTTVEATFDVPLDDPSLHLLAWRERHLSRLPPLREGESLQIPWTPGPFGLF